MAEKVCKCTAPEPRNIELMGGGTRTMCVRCRQDVPDIRWSNEPPKPPPKPVARCTRSYGCEAPAYRIHCRGCNQLITVCPVHGEDGHLSHE